MNTDRYSHIPAKERQNFIINTHLFFVWLGMMGMIFDIRPLGDQVIACSLLVAGYYGMKEHRIKKRSASDVESESSPNQIHPIITTDQ